MTESQKDYLKELINDSSSRIYFDESMKKHTSFKIGGLAECLIKIRDISTLEEVLHFAKRKNIPTTLIGNGSNVLVLDRGIKGITIQIDIQKIEIKEDNSKAYITVGAGNKLIGLAYTLLDREYTGLEELSNIPGTIGGAVSMNAGAHGKEMKDIVKQVVYLDENGEKKIMLNENANFGYRHSIFLDKDYVIIEVTICLEKGNKKTIKQKMEQYATYRKKNQPIEYPSSGSTFKRGEGFFTSKLIDECGLKGYSVGGAEVSKKHAGFIINKGNATAQDVLELVNIIKDKVYKKFGKKIELEMRIIGE